jgi:hypothetical protein
MPILKVLLLLIISLRCFSQVKVDKSVEARYEIAFKKMKKPYQQRITQLEIKEPFIGISVFTVYQVDTLNREDIINDENDVIVEDINPSPDKIRESDINENTYIPVFSRAELTDDTLHFTVGGPFPPTIIHKVYAGKVISSYNEYYKDDSVLRLNLKDSKVSQLSIPITTKKFMISTSSYKVGQVIYGQVEFETDPYYYDTLGTKNNYIRKRLKCIYFFKVRIKKNL